MTTATELSLKDKWILYKKENPKVRIRDAAKDLLTTEAELLAAFAGSSVLRLRNEFPAFMKRMPELGNVMSLTRNEGCVHERKGQVEEVSVDNPHVGLVLGKDIDLRLFFSQWAFGFAVLDNEEAGFKKSFQVFDHQGNAVIKIYPLEVEKDAVFEQLIRDFSAPVQDTLLKIAPPAPAHQYNDHAVNEADFRQAWSELKDTHDFFPMLRRFNVSRKHALTIAGKYAIKVQKEVVSELLHHAANTALEIMVFVSNPGNIQIHTGPVAKILEIPGWINVMDPSFNLHLKLDSIAETWVVEKPGTDGAIHSVEVYDAAGELVVQFFGKRKPGVPELPAWTSFVATLK